jgi:hypothetical protein
MTSKLSQITWNPVPIDEFSSISMKFIKEKRSGIIYHDVQTNETISREILADWDSLYLQGLMATHHVAQYNRVFIYACGTQIGVLKGQC